jgi:hypothetical protein
VERSILLVAALLAATLSGCGAESMAEDAPGPAAAVDDAPFVVVDGEVMVSCVGGTSWPPSVMAEGVQGVLSGDEARHIFQGILDDPRNGEEPALSLFPDGVDVEWRVLSQDDQFLTIGLGKWTDQGPAAGQNTDFLRLEREGDTWRAAGWGGCRLHLVLKADHSRAEVTGYQGDAGSTRITTQVSERECTSGRDPDRFLHEPYVIETVDSVTIYWTSEPPRGRGQTCPGNPSVDRVVELKEPIGTRTVFDGLSYPPRQVRAR